MRHPLLPLAALLLVTSPAPAQITASQPAGNGLPNLMSGPCAAPTQDPAASACDIILSPEYSRKEFSRFFDPAVGGNNETYATMPTLGGIGRPRFAEDRRSANRYQTSLNPIPVSLNDQYNDRTPFIFETRTTNALNYADTVGGLLVRTRVSGGGHNYFLPFASEKADFYSLYLDSIIRSPAQGGGQIGTTLLHTAPGDDMVFTVQHDTNGCSESEDECNKLFRSFLQTSVDRWGGILNTGPIPDAAGFGNYAIDVQIGPGYNANQSGEDVFLVNLDRTYTAGNMTSILEAPFTGLARITGDSAAAWSKRFGASTLTTLTAPIDNRIYNTACPSAVVASGYRTPDPTITDEAGIGGLPAFCATVGSTAGLADGESITLSGEHSNLEIARIVHIVDATHLTLNVQHFHGVGENLTGGGAQGYGISFLADDIAPGKLVNYAQPRVTLHKFFPIVASEASGALLVYVNSASSYEISSMGYMANQPNSPTTVASVTMRGTGVAAVLLRNGDDADYNARPPKALGTGQTTLAPPTVTFSGPCTTLPTALASYPYPGNGGHTGLAVAVTNPGVCSAPPTATLQTAWPNPYRIAPLAITRKVINPNTGTLTGGHLLVGALRPADWRAGDHVEIPGWIHDRAGSMRIFGKYYTGSSRAFGLANYDLYQGDWAAADILNGVVNQTDGHKYYASPKVPVGPGVAYEQPPDGFALAGDYRIHFRLYAPPLQSVVDIDCNRFGYGEGSYHPCMDGIQAPYNLFQIRQPNNVIQALRFDPTAAGNNLLSWSGPFRAHTVQLDPQPAPPCAQANRGEFVYTAGAGGTKDTVQVCAKDAADTFAWRTLY